LPGIVLGDDNGVGDFSVDYVKDVVSTGEKN